MAYFASDVRTFWPDGWVDGTMLLHDGGVSSGTGGQFDRVSIRRGDGGAFGLTAFDVARLFSSTLLIVDVYDPVAREPIMYADGFIGLSDLQLVGTRSDDGTVTRNIDLSRNIFSTSGPSSRDLPLIDAVFDASNFGGGFKDLVDLELTMLAARSPGLDEELAYAAPLHPIFRTENLVGPHNFLFRDGDLKENLSFIRQPGRNDNLFASFDSITLSTDGAAVAPVPVGPALPMLASGLVLFGIVGKLRQS